MSDTENLSYYDPDYAILPGHISRSPSPADLVYPPFPHSPPIDGYHLHLPMEEICSYTFSLLLALGYPIATAELIANNGDETMHYFLWNLNPGGKLDIDGQIHILSEDAFYAAGRWYHWFLEHSEDSRKWNPWVEGIQVLVERFETLTMDHPPEIPDDEEPLW